MTLKAIDIVEERSDDKGWFIMSEAASVDKIREPIGGDEPS
jgi:hypothetical protein